MRYKKDEPLASTENAPWLVSSVKLDGDALHLETRSMWERFEHINAWRAILPTVNNKILNLGTKQ